MILSRPQTDQLFAKRFSTHSSPGPHSRAATAAQPLSLTARPGFIVNQRVPTASDIAVWQNQIVKCKNFQTEFSPVLTTSRSEFPKTYGPPKTLLQKVKCGENLGPKWFSEEEDLPMLQRSNTNRFGLTTQSDTYRKLFPTSALDFHKLPSTTSAQWAVIDLNKDLELANYGVSSRNAFKTHWMKHNSLKHRKFFNTAHPEYEPQGISNHRIKDHIVDYRESMLGVRDMMISTWKAKK